MNPSVHNAKILIKKKDNLYPHYIVPIATHVFIIHVLNLKYCLLIVYFLSYFIIYAKFIYCL